MGSASATAMLVGRREMIDARPNAVTAEISRGEIEEALGSDQPLDLILDVLWPVHEGAGSASGTVTVAWDRADLESLLADSESESLTFSFDRDELGRVLDEPEFEGHGLRETAFCPYRCSCCCGGRIGGIRHADVRRRVRPDDDGRDDAFADGSGGCSRRVRACGDPQRSGRRVRASGSSRRSFRT